MGDFASPAAGPNGGICNQATGLNHPCGPGSSTTATGTTNTVVMVGGGGGGVPGNNMGIPKHSTVVERLRQRIEGCRRHHVNCENRYQQAHAEQLEMERSTTINLYQRSLEQRAKKSANTKQSKQLDPDSTTTTTSSSEQRNNTLIAVRTGLGLLLLPTPYG
ncbi:hypothetical protein NHX12_018354 [Muraenolepis orangiensis]|uniref:Neurogenic mastermind-like N-terminal domain-containing protein n=1 Tax=Muraenolepis orangiensis TaxID=630683 RepID=A0A9Q0IXH0_9TELE|nr:hypothetical protein NHX12_018354 [Muraenolepis orangiensis]